MLFRSRLEKKEISVMTSGKCTSAKEMRITCILEHHNLLCRKLHNNIVSDPNHKFKKLLPPVNDKTYAP